MPYFEMVRMDFFFKSDNSSPLYFHKFCQVPYKCMKGINGKTKLTSLVIIYRKPTIGKGPLLNRCRLTYSKVVYKSEPFFIFTIFNYFFFNCLPAVIATSQDIKLRFWYNKTLSNLPIKWQQQTELMSFLKTIM